MSSEWIEVCADGELLHVRIPHFDDRLEVIDYLRRVAALLRTGRWTGVFADTTPIERVVDVVDRIMVGSRLAEFWPPGVRIAIFANPIQVLPNHPLEHLVTSRGMVARVFTDREEALAWLRAARSRAEG